MNGCVCPPRFFGEKIGVLDRNGAELAEGDIVTIKEEGFDEESGIVRYNDKLVTFVVVFRDDKVTEIVPIKDLCDIIVKNRSSYEVKKYD